MMSLQRKSNYMQQYTKQPINTRIYGGIQTNYNLYKEMLTGRPVNIIHFVFIQVCDMAIRSRQMTSLCYYSQHRSRHRLTHKQAHIKHQTDLVILKKPNLIMYRSQKSCIITNQALNNQVSTLTFAYASHPNMTLHNKLASASSTSIENYFTIDNS